MTRRRKCKRWWKIGWLPVALCGLLGCEEPIKLELDTPSSRLVISSNFFPDEFVSLRVTATQPLLGAPVATDIRNAQVSLFEGNLLLEQLSYVAGNENGPGVYRTGSFKPAVGKEYTIHVTAQGFAPVTAVSSIPDPVAIELLRISDLSTVDVNGERLFDYHLTVNYKDPPNIINYYDLRIYQLVVPFVVSPSGDTIRMPPVTKSINTPLHRGIQGAALGILVQDKPPSGVLKVHLQSSIDPKRELLGNLVAELRTVSPEYFFYQRSLAEEAQAPSGELNEPVVIFNNIEKGLGVFAGYNSVTWNLAVGE